MPYYRRKQPVLLDEVGLHRALKRKASSRKKEEDATDSTDPRDDVEESPAPSTSPIIRKLEEPTLPPSRAKIVLLDERGLQRALKAKAKRKQLQNDSTQRQEHVRERIEQILSSPLSAQPAVQSPLKRNNNRAKRSKRLEDTSQEITSGCSDRSARDKVQRSSRRLKNTKHADPSSTDDDNQVGHLPQHKQLHSNTLLNGADNVPQSDKTITNIQAELRALFSGNVQKPALMENKSRIVQRVVRQKSGDPLKLKQKKSGGKQHPVKGTGQRETPAESASTAAPRIRPIATKSTATDKRESPSSPSKPDHTRNGDMCDSERQRSGRRLHVHVKDKVPSPEENTASVQADATNSSPSGKKLVKKTRIVRKVIKVKKPKSKKLDNLSQQEPTESVQPANGVILAQSIQRTHPSDKAEPPPTAPSEPTKPPARIIKFQQSPSEKPAGKNRSKNSILGSLQMRQPKKKKSNETASTARRSNETVSTLEDPSENLASSDHSQIDSKLGTSFRSERSSYHNWRPPPSWSVRNEHKTGFKPNEYLDKETMAYYTNNLGGVDTVATTTKIFYDKANTDPDLKLYFKGIRWEHMRNEFIILANIEVPDRFDDRLKGTLEQHCSLLENGADMDKLISLWENAIESSWLENRMDDARQLIVGPSRVLFNLKAMERHFAMHMKALAASSRAATIRSTQLPCSDDGGEPRIAIVKLNRKGGILSKLRSSS